MLSVSKTLDDSHCSALRKAITNVLDTDLADATFAQIIDGLPTKDVAWDRRGHRLRASHPLDDHKELCPGVVDQLHVIKAEFQINSLKFDHSLLGSFQCVKPTSHSFKLRLIELTAVSLHQIAVHLFQLQLNLHNPLTTRGLGVDAVVEWEPEPHPFFALVEPWPTLFTTPKFTAHQQYPNGVADMVGYWAEDRILGGVATFDRSKNWTGDSEPNNYFQSCREWATWRIWQLLPNQQEDLVRFLLQEPHSSSKLAGNSKEPLPLMPSRANTVRIDPIDAIPVHNVYRDPWEREEPPKLLRMQVDMAPCVVQSDDYPDMEDTDEQIQRLNQLWESRNR